MSQTMHREPLTAAKIARKKSEAAELLAMMRANSSNAELNAALLFVNDQVSAPYTIKELEMIVAGFVQVERVAEGRVLRHDYAEANERLQSLLPSTDSEERQRIATPSISRSRVISNGSRNTRRWSTASEVKTSELE